MKYKATNLSEREKMLIEVIEFYADMRNWCRESGGIGPFNSISPNDVEQLNLAKGFEFVATGGKKARQALKELEE